MISQLSAERFWGRVHRTTPNECWLWCGYLNRSGYGRGWFGGRPVLAHRMAWWLTSGEPPADLVVMHRCDQPRCCNPAHLQLGTLADNNADKISKGRHRTVTGERHPIAKLDHRRAFAIWKRRNAGESASALSREFGVSRKLIDNIAQGRAWHHDLGLCRCGTNCPYRRPLGRAG